MLSSMKTFVWSLVFMMMSWCNLDSASSPSALLSGIPTYSSSIKEVEEDEDLLLQVLIKLPVKSLLRFRCVSRKWNHIISSLEFGISHTRRVRHPSPTSLIMLWGRDWIILPLENDENCGRAIKKLNFDYIDDDPGVVINVIDSCNGLSLCHVASIYMGYFTFYVTNITTRKLIKLPGTTRLGNQLNYKLVLTFDPKRAPHFKVLCASQFPTEEEFVMEIYSSETDNWKRWSGKFINSKYIMDVFDPGVFWNGAIHWHCRKGDSFYFSIDDETVRVLPLPPFMKESHIIDGVRLMGQSGGHLHLVDVNFDVLHNLPINIYRMENNYENWVLMMRVSVNHLGSLFPEMVEEFQLDSGFESDDSENSLQWCTYYSFAVLSVIWADDGESLDMILLIPHHILSYNTKSRITKVLMRIEDYMDMHDYKWYYVFQFSDSFS